jgi:hypothetical protein
LVVGYKVLALIVLLDEGVAPGHGNIVSDPDIALSAAANLNALATANFLGVDNVKYLLAFLS